MAGLRSEVSQKMKDAIKAKLVELGIAVDEELLDYVMVLVVNKKSRKQMEADLSLFLLEHTSIFVNWLLGILGKLQTMTLQAKEKAAKAADLRRDSAGSQDGKAAKAADPRRDSAGSQDGKAAKAADPRRDSAGSQDGKAAKAADPRRDSAGSQDGKAAKAADPRRDSAGSEDGKAAKAADPRRDSAGSQDGKAAKAADPRRDSAGSQDGKAAKAADPRRDSAGSQDGKRRLSLSQPEQLKRQRSETTVRDSDTGQKRPDGARGADGGGDDRRPSRTERLSSEQRSRDRSKSRDVSSDGGSRDGSAAGRHSSGSADSAPRDGESARDVDSARRHPRISFPSPGDKRRHRGRGTSSPSAAERVPRPAPPSHVTTPGGRIINLREESSFVGRHCAQSKSRSRSRSGSGSGSCSPGRCSSPHQPSERSGPRRGPQSAVGAVVSRPARDEDEDEDEDEAGPAGGVASTVRVTDRPRPPADLLPRPAILLKAVRDATRSTSAISRAPAEAECLPTDARRPGAEEADVRPTSPAAEKVALYTRDLRSRESRPCSVRSRLSLPDDSPRRRRPS